MKTNDEILKRFDETLKCAYNTLDIEPEIRAVFYIGAMEAVRTAVEELKEQEVSKDSLEYLRSLGDLVGDESSKACDAHIRLQSRCALPLWKRIFT